MQKNAYALIQRDVNVIKILRYQDTLQTNKSNFNLNKK